MHLEQPQHPCMNIPLALLTDSYKSTHVALYPPAQKMVAYGEFRAAFQKDPVEERIVFYGMRYIIDTYINQPWTMSMLERAEAFFNSHNVGASPFPWPRDLFEKFIKENNGYFPVKIHALPEGTVIYPHVPVYQITAEKEYARLVTYLETLLTMVWYPSTVATLSRRAHTLIARAYDTSVDASSAWTLASRLHDFGFRGCTSVEQSVIGGVAHLLNFEGTDTLSAAYYAQFHLNEGKPVGFSIPATEHSIMTAHRTELDAMRVLLSKFGSGVCAVVMDSYDYNKALSDLLPALKSLDLIGPQSGGGLLVLRPDSGDPVEVVLQALHAADKVVGSVVNAKGYKVLQGVAVIQGDGIGMAVLSDILDAVLKAGFSAQNVAFGMGGGLLQKVNRDTMSFATKLCHIVYEDGTKRDVMKMPKTDGSKFSLPGEFAVYRDADSLPMVHPLEDIPPSNTTNILTPVYDHGRPIPGHKWESFSVVRERVEREWRAAGKNVKHNPLSPAMLEKIEVTRAAQEVLNEASYEHVAKFKVRN